MVTLEEVLVRLPDHKKMRGYYKARCPAHDDRNPSLSVWETPGGRVCLKCHATCSEESVWDRLGFPRTAWAASLTGPPALPPSRRETPNEIFETPEAAAEAYGLGPPDHAWPYVDKDGSEVAHVLRWNATRNREKRILPISPAAWGWSKAGPQGNRPLLNLPAILGAPEEPVYVVEGEKCCDTLATLGLLATTSLGGSAASGKTDWTPLANRSVFILPDNDDPGMKYADAVANRLSRLGASVRVICLDGLPPGGDVADLLSPRPTDQECTDLLSTIHSIANTKKEFQMIPEPTVAEVPSFEPFPTDALPPFLRTMVCEAAAAIQCDPVSVVMPCLTGLGVAAANWRVEAKEGWMVVPSIWTVVVAGSGERKSPPLDITLDIFRDWQKAIDREFEALPPSQRAKSRPKTIWTDNATVEGLNAAFQVNERSILFGCDELSTWLGNLGVYKSGRSQGDVGWYCQRYSGRASNPVRKGKDHQGGCASGLLGITGCATTGILRELLTASHIEAGLLARLLITMPPPRTHRWTEDCIQQSTVQAYRDLLERLAQDNELRIAHLSAEAKSTWIEFYDHHNLEIESEKTDSLAVAFRKQEELPLRLALIFHAIAGEQAISENTMASAVAITEWIKTETRRVYALLALRSASPADSLGSLEPKVREYISRKGPITARELQRNGPSECRSSGTAGMILDSMAKKGDVVAEPCHNESGRPTTRYRLAPTPTEAEESPRSIETLQLPPPEATEDYSEWTVLQPF